MVNPLVIKGAIYKNGNVLVRIAHSTGEYYLVDCIEYKTKDDILNEYSDEVGNDFINNNITLYHDGVEYVECEVSPHYTENFELLSDLSELSVYDENQYF